MTKNVPNRTDSIAKRVEEILGKRPFLVNALVQHIVNYSALARYIQKELDEKVSIDAIKTSLIREAENLRKTKTFSEDQVIKLFKKSKIELHDKIAVVITSRSLKTDYIASSIITSGFAKHNVYILDQTELESQKSEDIVTKNLIALIIKSSSDLEYIPGFVAFITQLLASNGINIKEFISCYTDTVIVLTKDDGLKAFNLLQKYV